MCSTSTFSRVSKNHRFLETRENRPTALDFSAGRSKMGQKWDFWGSQIDRSNWFWGRLLIFACTLAAKLARTTANWWPFCQGIGSRHEVSGSVGPQKIKNHRFLILGSLALKLWMGRSKSWILGFGDFWIFSKVENFTFLGVFRDRAGNWGPKRTPLWVQIFEL